MLPNAERELYIRGQILERRLPDDVMGRRAAKSLRAEGGSMAVGNISTLYLSISIWNFILYIALYIALDNILVHLRKIIYPHSNPNVSLRLCAVS